MNQVDTTILYQVNFPKTQAGKSASLYYTIYNPDETIHTARTQTGIKEFGDGSYGVELSFSSEGSYSIFWDIDGTNYVASEDIVIYDFLNAPDSYTGYGSGVARYGTIIGNGATLQFNFFKNGAVYSAYEVTKVEIYNSHANAEQGTNPIQTIATAGITESSTGVYNYTVAPIATPSTYFDKIHIVPANGLSTVTFISPFYERADFQGLSTEHETVRVYLNLYDIIDEPQKGDVVRVKMSTRYAWYDADMIKQEEKKFKADTNGLVTMDLIETDTLSDDTNSDVYYEFNIAGKATFRKQITKGLVQANFKDLPDYVFGAGGTG